MNAVTMKQRIWIAMGAIAALAIGFHFATAKSLRVHAAEERKILDRSGSLYEQITLAKQMTNITFREARTSARNGSTVSHLIVDISGDNGESNVVLHWNRGTGELIRVCNDVHAHSEPDLPVLSKNEAADITASWLRILGIASTAPKWTLAEGPEHVSIPGHISRNYVVHWRAANRLVILKIQDQTGELVEAEIVRN